MAPSGLTPNGTSADRCDRGDRAHVWPLCLPYNPNPMVRVFAGCSLRIHMATASIVGSTKARVKQRGESHAPSPLEFCGTPSAHAHTGTAVKPSRRPSGQGRASAVEACVVGRGGLCSRCCAQRAVSRPRDLGGRDCHRRPPTPLSHTRARTHTQARA